MRRWNKFGNKRRTVAGISFASGKEADRYLELDLLQTQGIIKDLKLQVRFTLQDGYTNGRGEKIRKMYYVADFVYTDAETGETVVEDVKGAKTQVYLLKKKLFEKVHYPLTITEV